MSGGDADKAATELEADLKELTAMLQLSKRPAVQAELERVHAKLEQDLKRARGQETPAPEPSAAAQATEKSELKTGSADEGKETKKPAAAPAAPAPAKVDVRSAGPWTEITTFALDLGGYDKPLVTVDVRLKGVEALSKENVTCDFTESSFDLKVLGLDGTNYRFLRTNLDKDIVPAQSEVKVKKNHVIVQLQKVKGEYGYDSWMDLCAKGKRKPAKKEGGSNPQDSIMGMMKDLYDDGDDNMKKVIGEAMYKANRGEKYDPKPEDLKMNSDI
jgi:calcyclin binding protein